MALTDKLTNISNAIRTKTGGTELIKLDDMPNEILSIQTGAADAVVRPLNVTSNGTYSASNGVDGFNPVTVNVPQTSGNRDNCLWTSGSWEEIQAVLDDYYAGNISDLRQYFQVGDIRTVYRAPIDNTAQTYLTASDLGGDVELVIVGIEHDYSEILSDNSAFDENSKVALTIKQRYADCYGGVDNSETNNYPSFVYNTEYSSATAATVIGRCKYKYSNAKKYFEYYETLFPTELKSMIKPVYKMFRVGGSKNYTYSEKEWIQVKLFAPSTYEITGTVNSNYNASQFSFDEQYEYYSNIADGEYEKYLILYRKMKGGYAGYLSTRDSYIYAPNTTSTANKYAEVSNIYGNNIGSFSTNGQYTSIAYRPAVMFCI